MKLGKIIRDFKKQQHRNVLDKYKVDHQEMWKIVKKITNEAKTEGVVK